MQALIVSNGIIEPAEPLNRSKFPPVQNSNELVAEKFRFLRHSQLEWHCSKPAISVHSFKSEGSIHKGRGEAIGVCIFTFTT